MKGMDEYAAVFLEEAGELLTELETTLLELEERPDDADLVARAFRALHTVKGSGAMFGFDDVASFTHELETVFAQVRDGRLAVTGRLVEHALRAKDLIRAMLGGGAEGLGEERDRLVGAFRTWLGGDGREEAAPGPEGTAISRPERPAGPARTYRVRLRAPADAPGGGADAEGLLDALRGLGPCRVVPLAADTAAGTMPGWDAVLTTTGGEDALRDAFLFADDRCEVRIDLVDDGLSEDDPPEYRRIGEILVERGDVSAEQLQEALASQRRLGDLLEEKGLVGHQAVEAAVLEQTVVREERARRAPSSSATEPASSLRVPAEKLDALVDLVGELVIAQARLTQVAGLRDDPELGAVSEEIDRLSAELRDNTLNIRMVPIGTTFGRFRRLVRDLSAELGKEIELSTEGAETELDKTVIDRLGDPLVHLIRNACGHGIEPPSARTRTGKPARGTVRLAAYHSGPNVFVEVADDGAGLDPERIRAKAVERGLLAPEARPPDKELFSLILLPGFSTAERLSNLSGRGVGMDVVKRSIEALRGTLEIESAAGAGTTVRIKLPLTLAIIEGLLVAVGEESYVLPLSMVEECVELTRRDVEAAHGSRLAAVRGELVPYLRLREWFGVDGDRPDIEQIAVANVEGLRFGFAVDGVVGHHQTVIKTLGRLYRDAEGLAGATILGDGSVALILDAPALVKSATEARH